MKRMDVDVAIIGTGTAGMTAYRNAAKHTSSIAVIEGGEYGTTCARVGCMPSKLLIAAAETSHIVDEAKVFGINTTKSIDGKAVMKRVRDMRDEFVGYVRKAVDENFDDNHKIKGMATFKDNQTLIIDDHTEIKAKRIVIATGSRPMIPDMFDPVKDKIILNDDVFDWDTLPESVAVFGAGVIGLELGQALHRLGVRVRLFGRNNRIAGLSDPEVTKKAIEYVEKEMPFLPDAKIKSMGIENNQAVIEFSDDNNGKDVKEYFDHVLVATGRVPNVDNLNLNNTDLDLNEKGVPIYNRHTMQTSQDHIFIAGDVNNNETLLHVAANEGQLVGNNAGMYPNVRAQLRQTFLGVVFSDPQIAIIGESYQTLSQSDHSFRIGEVSFEDQGRSRVMNKGKGLLRLYGCAKTGCVLGGEMVGPAAEHLGHLIAWIVHDKKQIDRVLDDLPFYHPVIEEGLRTALRDLSAQLKMLEEEDSSVMECGPGA